MYRTERGYLLFTAKTGETVELRYASYPDLRDESVTGTASSALTV